ncbi:MAG: hypothetical protein ACFFDT_22440 [Candidatus Hodarchaeota archaeon]
MSIYSLPKTMNRFSWWWWFWLFFIDPFSEENPTPPQIMVLWSSRNSNWIKANSLFWKRDKTILRQKNRTELDGIIAGWYFDGKVMHDDIVLNSGKIVINRSKEGGSVNAKEDNWKYIFKTKEEDHTFLIDNDMLKVNFNSSIAPKNDFTRPITKGRSYLGGLMSYSILKMNRLEFDGTIDFSGKHQNVRGLGYFQKVTLDVPPPLWYWTTIFFEDGSMLKYFLPHEGAGIFRSGYTDKPFRGENTRVRVKREMEFFDAETKEVHFFKKIKIEKLFQKKSGLPYWKLKAKKRDKRISIELQCYSRTCFRLEGSVLGVHFLSKAIYYNEYPTKVVKFKFKDKDYSRTLQQIGKGIGNTEHAWGILL